MILNWKCELHIVHSERGENPTYSILWPLSDATQLTCGRMSLDLLIYSQKYKAKFAEPRISSFSFFLFIYLWGEGWGYWGLKAGPYTY